ncbi:MAG: protease SohB [Pseudomonadota bacterium]|nr:protease SohB [Pseudomonadota bacterium]
MTAFFLDFSLFLLKAITIVLAIIAVLFSIASISRRESRQIGLTVEKLNDKYRDMADILQQKVLGKADWKAHQKNQKKELKEIEKNSKHSELQEKRIFVLDFKGDVRATAVESLREEITAVISVANQSDEVIVRLDNSGGAVQDHGLGASQLQRIKDNKIPLVVIVDKVAASGGYLMASVANKIVAAPFAIIGSIGVLAQLPNFNRLLEKQGIDWEQVTAGKYKRTLTMFGKNTEEDREKTRQDLEEVHGLFKGAVSFHRPNLDVESVSTGEYWYGTKAMELGLVDELGSSDDYLLN